MAKKKAEQAFNLLKGATDILQRFENPTITFVPSRQEQRDEETHYIPFGINIIVPDTDTVWPNFMPVNITDYLAFNTRDTGKVRMIVEGREAPLTFHGNIAQYIFQKDHTPNFFPITTKEIFFTHEGGTEGKITPERLPIAIVYKNILFPCFHFDTASEEECTLFAYVIEQALQRIPKAEFPRQKPANYESIQFASAITKFYRNKERGMQEQIERLKNETEEHLERYLIAEKNLLLLDIEREAIKANALNLEEENRKVADAFTRNTKCKSWKISGNILSFTLQNLHLTYRGETLDLPEILVNINIDSGEFKPSMPSLPKVIPMHPHVFERGNPCLGNFSTLFRKILATGKFQQILDLLIQFFESYNPESPVPGGAWEYYRKMLKEKTHDINHSDAVDEWREYLERSTHR